MLKRGVGVFPQEPLPAEKYRKSVDRAQNAQARDLLWVVANYAFGKKSSKARFVHAG